jgi:LPXTG-motif cell wall-anchored protein
LLVIEEADELVEEDPAAESEADEAEAGLSTEVEESEENDIGEPNEITATDGPENQLVLIPPILSDKNGLMPQSRSAVAETVAPMQIVALVELFPPAYDWSIEIPGLFGFRGVEWKYIFDNGFTEQYNTVSIISGYFGDEWMYGVSGDTFDNAIFANNKTIHCMEPGMTAPCPNGDNVREVVMYYIEDFMYLDGFMYHLYFGSAQFGYEPIYAYSERGQEMGFFIAIRKTDQIPVLKLDADTDQPITNTEFTLFSYPVSIVDGRVVTDTAQITAHDPAWIKVDVQITDSSGLLNFIELPYGYYQVVESCPHPEYKSYEESGGQPCFVTIDRDNTPSLQVFKDERIQIGVEVYKDTVKQTSAAFSTDELDYLKIDNIGQELYHYDLYFRSTANVRVDELTIIDPLENVAAGQVRIVEVFTPVTWGDSDGLFNLWYQTNRTDFSMNYSDVSALDTNPDNPNNPNKQQVWPSTGWQLWQAGIPTTASKRLSVKGLGLADGEYITALRFEYGSVEIGFTNANGPINGIKETGQDASAFSSAIDWTPNEIDRFYSQKAAEAAGLLPATYLVACPVGMLPPDTISSSVTAYQARNLVLTDQAYDEVTTKVIEPFMVATDPFVPLQKNTQVSYPHPASYTLPRTGDDLGAWSAGIVVGMLMLGASLVFISRRKPSRQPVKRW